MSAKLAVSSHCVKYLGTGIQRNRRDTVSDPRIATKLRDTWKYTSWLMLNR